MPYVIHVTDRRLVAVATLEEAREAAYESVMERVNVPGGWKRGRMGRYYPALDFSPHALAALELPEDGCTIGPLPDGTTTIRIEPAHIDALDAVAFPPGRGHETHHTDAEIIRAFNEFQDAETRRYA